VTAYRGVPLAFERLAEDEALARSRQFLAGMRTRRSVRDFSRAPVPWELVENAVAAAGSAPSGAHQQPWTFAVVSDPDLKRRMREAAEAEERENYERRMSEEWKRELERLGTDWRKPHIEDAPHVIVVFEHAYGFATDGSGSKRKHYYAKESVGIAVGILLTALHRSGLATLTHTPSPMGFLARLLDRPPNERAYVLIPVGYPADGCEVPVLDRKPLAEILVRY
jgi:iodotyrosine deiodinase